VIHFTGDVTVIFQNGTDVDKLLSAIKNVGCKSTKAVYEKTM